MEPFESEGRPGAVANEAFQPVTVGGFDKDAAVEAEPTTVIPGEHVLGLVAFQEAVAGTVAENPPSNRVLEMFQEFAGEGGGFVETEAGFWIGRILNRVTLNLLEEPFHDAHVVVKVGVQRRAEAMREADGAHGG